MQWLAENLWWMIAALGGAHLVVFGLLVLWRRAVVRHLQVFLHSLLGKIEGTSDLLPATDPDDQIEAFLQDTRAVLTNDFYRPMRADIARRLVAKLEQWSPFRSKWFETSYSVCRSGVEVYPLLGILGTLVAMNVALQTQQVTAEASLTADAQSVAGQADAATRRQLQADQANSQTQAGAENAGPAEQLPQWSTSSAVTSILDSFGAAISSTIAGLVVAVVLMVLNAAVEPSFARLTEYKAAVRLAIRDAERELLKELGPRQGPALQDNSG